ncbi:hypothetical protein ABZV91_12230 [Nocardia sp. NPDC004568]|uniref:hypothetical protein n=1 Tax=Nocardia sp. NPDC004568 TaxID=3154551 RepID=UPI0033A7DA4F
MRERPPLPKRPARNRAMEATVRLLRDQYRIDIATLERVAAGLRATHDVPEPATDADIAP